MERQEMNPQDRRLEIKGLDIDQLYSGGWCDRLTSDWRDDWLTLRLCWTDLSCSAAPGFVFVVIWRCLGLKKLKWSRYRPGVAKRVGSRIALLFHDRGTRRGWVVSSTPRLHFIPGKDPVPILREAWWAPGPVWTGGKSRPHRDSIPDRPARSQSLYWLSYRAHAVRLCTFGIYQSRYVSPWVPTFRSNTLPLTSGRWSRFVRKFRTRVPRKRQQFDTQVQP